MAISANEQQLLATFPRPPTSLASSSPPPNSVGEPSPRLYRPSDFGFITVGHKTRINRDSASVYDEPIHDDEQTYSSASFAPVPVHLPTSKNATGIQLVLDNPSKLYAPLETVTGYVIGCDANSLSSSHLHIILEGRAKSYFHDANFEYHDRAPLVYQTTHIKPGKETLVPRFSIPIPERTSSGLERLKELGPTDSFTHKPYWTYDWPKKEPFNTQTGHPLPPSMIMPLRSASPLGKHPSGHGYIEYKIIAIRSHLDPESGKLKSEAACQVPIWITTRRMPRSQLEELQREQSSATTKLSISTSQLMKERQLTIREQFRDALNASLPSFYFSTTTTVPKLSTPGSDLKIGITVSIVSPPAGKLYNFSIPDISVSSIHIVVRSYTGLRIFRPSLLDSSKPLQLKSHTFKSIELQTSKSLPSAKFVPRNGNYDAQSCVVTASLPKTTLPSFRTYNFWRSYRLECDVTFRVAGKEVSAHSRSDLNVVARGVGSVGDLGPGYVEADVEDAAATLEMAQVMVGMTGVSVDLMKVSAW